MTLGDGIFASTLLLVVVAGLWAITRKGKWRLVGKVSAVLVLLIAVGAVGLWGWSLYEERAQVLNELDGVRLGMTRLDLQVAKGKPFATRERRKAPPLAAGFHSDKSDPWEDVVDPPSAGRISRLSAFDQFDPSDDTAQPSASTWLYGDPSEQYDDKTVVVLAGDGDDAKVVQICRVDTSDSVFGLHRWSGESAVFEKLGPPTRTSIRGDGLAKMISYRQWNVGFSIEQGQVSDICIAQDGNVRYATEYKATKPATQ